MKQTALVILLISAVAIGYFTLQMQPHQTELPKQKSATPVTLWEVSSAEFVDEISALGSLRAWESVVIAAGVSERVESVHFEDGDTVAAGAVLITLRQDEEQAALREQEEIGKEADREVKRLLELAKRNQVAQTELDSMRTRAAIARHKLDELQAGIADRIIVAPFAGVLGLRIVSPGALVSVGQTITTLDDVHRLRLDFSVPATLLGSLQVGQPIRARTPAFDREFPGSITAIDARVDPLTRSIITRAALDNPDGLLKPGMLIEVTLLTQKRQVLLLPEESLISQSARHFVWVVEDGLARRTDIVIGVRKPGWVEVISGVSAGARIVRDGVGNLRGTEAAVRIVES
ncbi:MAG: membrane fusion protein (multidrug efflux system) [Halioglobus sp.]|jgi:membrane fusion protein (multidrug efflux system)